MVSILSTFYVQIFCTNVVFSSYMYVEKTTFVQKIRVYNVDEIDTGHFYDIVDNIGF